VATCAASTVEVRAACRRSASACARWVAGMGGAAPSPAWVDWPAPIGCK
jgi:hypothetical protein